MNSETKSTTYYSNAFPYKDGHLYCENLRIKDVVQHLKDENIGPPCTPCFIYSKAKIVSNVNSYLQPLGKLPQKTTLNFSVKANMNISILKLLKSLGCSCTLVSGYELKLCLELGFEPTTMVLNGNGKQDWEIELAVRSGCLLNIDSLFNLRQTIRLCERLETCARVLIRVNPDINVNVHQYNTTGKSGSNFGVDDNSLREVLDEIKISQYIKLNVHQYNTTGKSGSKFGVDDDNIREVLDEIKISQYIKLVGLHCHLGSTIQDLQPFRDSTTFLLHQLKNLRSEGFSELRVLNIGGGLGIPYEKHAFRTSSGPAQEIPNLPSAGEVVHVVADILRHDDVTLILEPGRSLVGDTAILATSVLGVKSSGSTNYIVVDGSMTEMIRPALYQSYHHIDLAEPTLMIEGSEQHKLYNVVGPVCESGDFLGKERYLFTPHEGCLMAVFDVGAYCASMSSNYNMRPRAAEVLVDQSECTVIRKPDTFESMINPYL